LTSATLDRSLIEDNFDGGGWRHPALEAMHSTVVAMALKNRTIVLTKRMNEQAVLRMTATGGSP
jgi:hypothetical protein